MMNPHSGIVGGWRREDKEPSRAEKLSTSPNYSEIRTAVSKYLPSINNNIESDLRKFSPSLRHDQLNTSTCSVNAMTRALENKRIQHAYSDAIAQGKSEADALALAQLSHIQLSRLALYFLAREEMDPPETDKDAGTIISIVAELLHLFGVARETPNGPDDRAYWPFDTSKVCVSPTWLSMRDSSLHKISGWFRITSNGNDRVDDVIANLAVGNPVVFGTEVGANFTQYNGGVIQPVNGLIQGGHATMLCGWDPSGFFWDENSWGNNWGYDGFAKVAPEVIASSDSSDFIVITSGWEPWLPKEQI